MWAVSPRFVCRRVVFVGAVELRNDLARALGLELPSTLIYDYPTVTAIVDYALKLQSPQTSQTPSAGVTR